MARLVTLDSALEAGDVLFDTMLLIDLFKGPWTDPRVDLLVRIPRNRRLATELVLWQFLHPKDVTAGELRERRRWIRSPITPLPKYPVGYLATYRVLLAVAGARGDAVDASLAACTIASGGRRALATADADHFCWHRGILLVVDFLPGGACPS